MLRFASFPVQITKNTTGMEAGLSVATDKEGREHCVVVVKGTFQATLNGEMTLAARQRPLVYTDDHYGDPETSCVRYECEFPFHKPYSEVLVVGKAVVPDGRPTPRVDVRLEVNGRNKDIAVFGERRWIDTGVGVVASRPVPFVEMPLTFERAFGGRDDSRGPGRIAVEDRNLVGVGFNPHRSAVAMDQRPLPNLERPRQLIERHRDRPEPIGLGVLGRSSRQRISFAGTYDQDWLDDVCPFLPSDFDLRYFMSAASDQWFPPLRGGEVIRCVHMAERPVVQYVLPSLDVPVSYEFETESKKTRALLDTVIVEPHVSEAMLLWRTHVFLPKKVNALREITVGHMQRPEPISFVRRNGRRRFNGLSHALRRIKQYQD